MSKLYDEGAESENHFVFLCPLYSEELFNRLLVSKYNDWYDCDVQDKQENYKGEMLCIL